MEFKTDIFLSYAHLDNDEVGDVKWVNNFYDALNSYVTKKWGRKPELWQDVKRLSGNSEYDPKILGTFPQLKVMVSIITPRYLESSYCKTEVETFFISAEQTGGVSIDNDARIFKIIKSPQVDKDQLPARMQKFLDFKFYGKISQEDKERNKDREYSPEFGKEYEQAFFRSVDDVADDIVRVLKKIGSPQPSKGKIYLADTTDDLKIQYDSIKRELQDANYTVVPNEILPFSSAEKYVSRAESIMKDCRLSIHLVGYEDYGIVPGKTDKSVLELQNEISSRLCAATNSELSQLIWIVNPNENKSPVISDDRIKEFISQLTDHQDLHNHSDLFEGDADGFKRMIRDTLQKQEESNKQKALEKEKAALKTTSPGSNEVDPKIIYLVCDKRDIAEVKPIKEFLDAAGHDIKLQSFNADETSQLKRHEELLQSCDAVIVYWGTSDLNWMESMVLSINKIKGLRATPFVAKLAYICGPNSDDKDTIFSTKQLEIKRSQNGFSKDDFNGFLDKLKTGAGKNG